MAVIIPTSGQTWCTIIGGRFSYTYDGDIYRACEFKPNNQSCLSNWCWNTPVNVTAINIFSGHYHESNHAYIYMINGLVNGSWVRLLGGWGSGVKIHPTHKGWYKININCDNCTGIEIATMHPSGAPIPSISDINFDYTAAPPPPEEGKAVITKVEAPETFEPNKTFPIRVTFRNDGGGDYFFVRIINRDTGENIHELRVHLSSGTSWTTYHSINISQGTDFHCRAEAGHEE